MKRLLEIYTVIGQIVIAAVFCAVGAGVVGAQTAGPGLQTIYKISQFLPHGQNGCNWTTGLLVDGVTNCPDDTTTANQILANCTPGTTADLVFDVSIELTSPILEPVGCNVILEGTTASGLNGGTGVFMRAGSNSTVICAFVGHLSTCQDNLDGFPISAQAGSLVIRNLGIEGNSATTGNNSSSGDQRCSTPDWCMGILAANLSYYELSNVSCLDIPTYCSLTSNIGREVEHNVRITSPGQFINTDGIHKDGPWGSFSMDHIYCHTGDDCVALNTVEGIGGLKRWWCDPRYISGSVSI